MTFIPLHNYNYTLLNDWITLGIGMHMDYTKSSNKTSEINNVQDNKNIL